jgi:hypothetical protein
MKGCAVKDCPNIVTDRGLSRGKDGEKSREKDRERDSSVLFWLSISECPVLTPLLWLAEMAYIGLHILDVLSIVVVLF